MMNQRRERERPTRRVLWEGLVAAMVASVCGLVISHGYAAWGRLAASQEFNFWRVTTWTASNWTSVITVLVAVVATLGGGYVINVLIKSVRNSPWSTLSRPSRWTLSRRKYFSFRKFVDSWRRVCGRRAESYLRPKSGPRTRSSVPVADSTDDCEPADEAESTDETEPVAETLYICLEDDACGINVGGPAPAIIYCDQSDGELDDLTEKLLYEAIQQPQPTKFACVIIASRMASAQEAMERFFKVGQYLVRNLQRSGFGGKVRWGIRTDSCLRLHYHAEMSGLDAALRTRDYPGFDLDVFLPANVSERRVTNYGVQFFFDREAKTYIPIHETRFATHFRNFEYSTSNLAVWMEEKTANSPVTWEDDRWQISRREVHLVNVNVLRTKPVQEIVARILKDTDPGRRRPAKALVIDAEDSADLTVACEILDALEAAGKHLLFHAGTSLTARLSGNHSSRKVGIDSAKRLFGASFRRPGLVVAGSMTKRTQEQVLHASRHPNVGLQEPQFEHVNDVDSGPNLRREIRDRIRSFIARQQNFILHTRETVTELNGYPVTAACKQMREFLAQIVRDVNSDTGEGPGWLMFKGSDTALYCILKGLRVSEIEFIGPCEFAAGVFLCRTVTPESHPWHDTPILLCAGNSGDRDSIRQVISHLGADNTSDRTQNASDPTQQPEPENRSDERSASAEL